MYGDNLLTVFIALSIEDTRNAILAKLAEIKTSLGLDTEIAFNFQERFHAVDDYRFTGTLNIFLTNPQVVNVLLGLNPNGTKRIQLVKTDQLLEKHPISTAQISWADLDLDDDSEEELELYVTREEELPPLVAPIIVDEKLFKFSRVPVQDDEPENTTNVLTGWFPAEITTEKIYEKLALFSHNPEYPKVIKTKTSKLGNWLYYIYFDPLSYDALYAEMITWNTRFDRIDTSRTVEPHRIRISLARKQEDKPVYRPSNKKPVAPSNKNKKRDRRIKPKI